MPEIPANRPGRSGGFTLIELMVVIAIIGLLAAALLPNIIAAFQTGNRAAVEGNMKWHYQSLHAYKNRYGKFPVRSGVGFVVAPWVEKVVEKTDNNFERYWSPALTADPDKIALEDIGDMDQVWTSFDEVSDTHTHFAGPDRRKVRTILSGKTAIMASHSPFGPALDDGTTVVLLGDGSTTVVQPQDLGYDPETGEPVPIGDDTDHELLQQLTR